MLINRPRFIVDHYHRELADRATRRALRVAGLVLLAVLIVGVVIGVMTWVCTP